MLWIEDILLEIPNFWYWITAAVFTVVIRAILSYFKALAINNGEIDDSNKTEEQETKWRGIGLKRTLIHSFWSNGKDIRIDDYWLPAVIGFTELIIFPIFMARTWYPGIGAWIAIKTASSWGGWQKTRTAYNRFLLGNILSLVASFLMLKVFNL